MTFGLTRGTEKLDEALQDIDALVFNESLPKQECTVRA